MWKNIITEQASAVHFYWVINWDLDGSVRTGIPEYGQEFLGGYFLLSKQAGMVIFN